MLLVRGQLACDEVSHLVRHSAGDVEAAEGHVLQGHDARLGAVGAAPQLDGPGAELAVARLGGLGDDRRVEGPRALHRSDEPPMHLLVHLLRKLPGQKLVDVAQALATDNTLDADACPGTVLDLQILDHFIFQLGAPMRSGRELGVTPLRGPHLVVAVRAQRREGLAQARARTDDGDGRALPHLDILQRVAFRFRIQGDDAIPLRREVVDELDLLDANVHFHLPGRDDPTPVDEVTPALDDDAGHGEAGEPGGPVHACLLQKRPHHIREGVELVVGIMVRVDHPVWRDERRNIRDVLARRQEQVHPGAGTSNVRCQKHVPGIVVPQVGHACSLLLGSLHADEGHHNCVCYRQSLLPPP
mmetsp:Transcript_1437/g.5765  ORF Transcript_1437/g.5765 Transcript_1437/m.5765 type:complete len:358 (-) Transcript_1437:22-1095(-)